MITRTYGQYCGLARALELVGERWALLVVRDLILGPKRFTELRQGLPKIPSNILSARLKELEQTGVVQRRLLPRPGAAVVYDLTDYGRELEPIVLHLGGWGARSLAEPRPDDTLNADSLCLALLATFRPDAARGLRATYEIRLGEVVVHARVEKGTVEVSRGPAAKPDLVIESDLTLGRLILGHLRPAEAAASGKVRFHGKRRLFERFGDAFLVARKEDE